MSKEEISAAEVRKEAERKATQDYNEATKPLWVAYLVALEKAKLDYEESLRQGKYS